MPALHASERARESRGLRVRTTVTGVAAGAEVRVRVLRSAGLAFLSFWALGGCATLPPCPAKGGPIWREAVSAHFRLRSDLDEDDARETIRRLEEIRASMLAMVWP